MKYLKLFIIGAGSLFLIMTLFSLFIPSTVRISKAIDIRGGKEELRRQIGDAANWKNWFWGKDSASKNFVITEINSSTIVAETINTKKPVTSTWNFLEYSGSDTVTVQWYLDFHLRWYPWEKLASLLLENVYGNRMAESLERLRAIAEN
jgi:hypothetical protein